MDFDKGAVGVLLVILSLIGSVAFGVVTNIETTNVTKDVEEYVADITGAFESERQQSYTNYNPSSNYNGYTNNTVFSDYPVEYESSSYTNNYPISYESSMVSETYTTPESLGTEQIWNPQILTTMRYPGFMDNLNEKRYDVPDRIPGYDYSVSYRIIGPRQGGYINANPDLATHYIPLSTVIQNCKTEGASVLGVMPDNISITIPATVMRQSIEYLTIPYYPDMTPPNENVYYLSSNVFFVSDDRLFDTSSYTSRAEWTINDLYTTSSVISLGEGESYTINLIYDVSEDKADILVNGNPILAGISPQGYSMVYGTPTYTRQSYEMTGNLPSSPPNESISVSDSEAMLFTGFTGNTLSVKYILETHTDYIDTRYGIGIRDEEDVTWSNKQQNGITKIAFSTWNGSDVDNPFSDGGMDYSNTATLRYRGTNVTDTFTISRTGGTISIILNGGSPVPIGTWKQIELTLDNINGTLIATPIQTWDNFNNYSLSETFVEVGPLNKYNLTSINWTADNTFRFQVSDTTVFFNNYGVVMIDPHITISDLWPNYSRYMVSISKVATIGDSITLGTDTYPIEDGYITIDGKRVDVTQMDIYYEKDGDNWDVTIKFGKEEVELDDISTYIGMNGMWYFVAGFYNITTKVVSERTWDPFYNFVEGRMFFWTALILIGLSIIAYKMGYLDWVSIIILISTEVILLLIGGVT